MEYKKVYKRNLDKSNGYYPPFIGVDEYYPLGAIRDDITERKAYAILFENYISNFCPVNEEYLLYNFSLSINDTVDFCSFIGYDDINVITEIYDDIRYDQNTIVFNSSGFHEYLEGIGSPFGLFEDIFLAYKKDRFPSNPELIYYCPTDDCDVILGDNRIIAFNMLKTYPNPANTQITFELPAITQESILQIKDVYGKVVGELHLIRAQTQIIWNCSNIASGVYFYQTKINGEVCRGKIVLSD